MKTKQDRSATKTFMPIQTPDLHRVKFNTGFKTQNGEKIEAVLKNSL